MCEFLCKGFLIRCTSDDDDDDEGDDEGEKANHNPGGGLRNEANWVLFEETQDLDTDWILVEEHLEWSLAESHCLDYISIV